MMADNFSRRTAFRLGAGFLAYGHGIGSLAKDTYPQQHVSIVVPFPPGAGPDLAARVLGQHLAKVFGQTFIVENKPGAGALVGASAVARSKPDGYTLLLTPNTMAISPFVLPVGAGGKLDVQKDLVPIIAISTASIAVLVRAELGVKSLSEFIARAKAKPGMTFGSAGNGSPMHFAGEMLKKSAGIDLLHVPYKGVAASVTAALSGEVDVLIVGLAGVLPLIKANRLVSLAVLAKRRSDLAPEIPTAAEQGVPGVEVNAWYGIFGPADIPLGIVSKLNDEINTALRDDAVRVKLKEAGLELLGGASSVLGDFMKADSKKYSELAREFNIRAD